VKLISSREAVDFLSQAAPRPWVHRLLRWMAFDEGLPVYARRGKVQPHTTVSSLTMKLIVEAGERSGPKLDILIREKFSPEFAARLIGQDPYSRIDDEPTTWGDVDDPQILDVGFFLYASELDFDGGTLKAEWLPSRGEIAETFFSQDEYFGTEFDDPEFDAEFSGLCFDFAKIEMLLPNLELRPSTGFTTDKSEWKRAIGRPPKWDWEGSMAFVISQAQLPDGLPTGPGAQARIEEMMACWFSDQTGDSPAPSQIRQRAGKIMETLEKPKTPRTPK
jgi:hypothetical protein